MTIDGGGVDWHNVMEGLPGKRGDHVFKSPELTFNGAFSSTFNETGEFEYYCEPHPFMIGKITVSYTHLTLPTILLV